MIIADCSIIVRLVADVDDSSGADLLRIMDPDWCVPTLWEAEFAHALRKYERAGRISVHDSEVCCRIALELFEQTTHHVTLARVLETSRRTGCSTYDSHYIALAEDLGLKLYTYDEDIIAKCPRVARRA